MSALVTAEHLKQFDRDGYFVLPSVIPAEHIAMMNEVIQRAVKKRNQSISTNAVSENEINKDDGLILCSADGKYFFFMHEDCEPELNQIIFSPYMEEIAKAVLGDTVYYTHSEIVVKGGQKDKKSATKTAFSWHQDSGYVPYEHTPYLSCWCAFTEMTSTNGTLSVLPIERNPRADENHQINWAAKPRPAAQTKFPCYQHKRDETSPDMVGYFGSDPGVEVQCPIGSIVVFSTLTLHCSSPNRTDAIRSAYNVQYASTPLMSEDHKSFRHKAQPFPINSQTADEVKKCQE